MQQKWQLRNFVINNSLERIITKSTKFYQVEAETEKFVKIPRTIRIWMTSIECLLKMVNLLQISKDSNVVECPGFLEFVYEILHYRSNDY